MAKFNQRARNIQPITTAKFVADKPVVEHKLAITTEERYPRNWVFRDVLTDRLYLLTRPFSTELTHHFQLISLNNQCKARRSDLTQFELDQVFLKSTSERVSIKELMEHYNSTGNKLDLVSVGSFADTMQLKTNLSNRDTTTDVKPSEIEIVIENLFPHGVDVDYLRGM